MPIVEPYSLDDEEFGELLDRAAEYVERDDEDEDESRNIADERLGEPQPKTHTWDGRSPPGMW